MFHRRSIAGAALHSSAPLFPWGVRVNPTAPRIGSDRGSTVHAAGTYEKASKGAIAHDCAEQPARRAITERPAELRVRQAAQYGQIDGRWDPQWERASTACGGVGAEAEQSGECKHDRCLSSSATTHAAVQRQCNSREALTPASDQLTLESATMAQSTNAATPMQLADTAATPATIDATPTAADSTLKRKVDDDAAAAATTAAAASARGGGRGGGNKRGRSGRGGRGGGYSNRNNDGAEDAEGGAGALEGSAAAAAVAAVPSAPLTPLQQQFQLYAGYLDQRNDRRELVYVASRELTRTSKKLISMLQRCTHCSPEERSKQLASARSLQLAELHRLVDATVSDLSADESYRLAGAYSPGFQEFVEAASFLFYLEHATAAEGSQEREQSALLTHAQLEADLALTLGHRVSIPLSDYLVGLTDLGGELMRYATNSVTAGDRSIIARICTFLREVYALFQGLACVLPQSGAGPYKEMGKKMEVWMQSLVKIETRQSTRAHTRRARRRNRQAQTY